MALIDDVLKPKSKDEIDDLERRGFRKDGGKWKFRIDISPLIKAFEEDDDTEAFKQGIISLLEEKVNDIGIYAGEDEQSNFQNIIDEFQMLDESPSPDEVDHVMEMLYDWADNNDVWIDSF
ncbi:MAG: hypothetical protein GYA51_18995 [Candidatus Methanofastidiosa archaeon]|nr:hypothetical protein [Candidatus Methanofastidiosa archaeon]